MRERTHRPQRVRVSSRTPVDPTRASHLLGHGASWTRWSPVIAYRLERAGAAAPEGPGAVRVLRVRVLGVPATCRQQVLENTPRRFRYTLLAGLPLRDYHGQVSLAPARSGGAHLEWNSSFRPAIPATGWVCAFLLRRFIHRCVAGLAAHAAYGDARPE